MAEETKHGYMRVRNPESEKAGVGIFDKFLPVTRADLVITDEQSAESLADKLIAIDDHMATNDFSVMPERTAVLSPGAQIIESSRVSSFHLKEIKGKTLINPIGIIGVENPYALSISDNLIPPFYEWSKGAAKLVINGPYSATYTRSGPGQNIFVDIPTVENTSYSFSVEADIDYSGEIQFYDDADIVNGSHVSFTDEIMFTTPPKSTHVRVVLLTRDGTNGTVTFSNPTLTIGTGVKSFKPQRKSMLAFQTELFSNLNGEDSDMLFRENGRYYKLTKWKKIIANESLTYMYVPTNLPGFKVVYIVNGAVDAASQSDFDDDDKLIATKYNGVPLTVDDSGVYTWPSADLVRISASNIYLSIADTASGWGANYEPSQEEIKAYFMGWRMASPDNWGAPYPGTGIKAWGRLDKDGNLVSGSGTDILPTVPNTEGGYVPYNILYRLAKESLEPVTSEGNLIMSQGSTMVEVGTGVVLREHAIPVKIGNYYVFNSLEPGRSNPLKFKVDEFLALYSNNRGIIPAEFKNSFFPYGKYRATIHEQQYDPDAAYSLTYLKLDKSHVVNMVGGLSPNERSQIDNLIADTSFALEQSSILQQEVDKLRTEGSVTLRQDVDKLKTDTETALEQASALQQEVISLRSEVDATFQSGVSAKAKVVSSTNANYNQGVTTNHTWDVISNAISKMYGPGSSIPLNKIIPIRKFTQSWTKTVVANARHLHARNGGIAIAHQNSVGTKSVIRYNRNSVEMWAKTDIGMAVDAHIDAAGDILVAYSNLSGTTLRKIGSISATELWADSEIINARAITSDQYGYIYAAHSNTPGNRTIRKFDSSGSQIWYDTAGYGTALAIGEMSGSLFAAYANPGTSAGTIRRYTMSGDEVWVDNTSYPPTRIALDQDENLYVTYQTSSNITIRKINYNGTEQWASSHIRNPVGIAVDEDGFVYVAANNPAGTSLYILDKNGTIIGEDAVSPSGYGVSPDGEGNIIVSYGPSGQMRKLYHNVAYYKLN